MYNRCAALSCSMNLFPTENYFTAATKRVISSIQSFTKKHFWKKGKRFWRDSSVSSEYWWTLQWKFDHARIFFPMYANFFQTTPDSLTSFKYGHLQKNIYIYKYIFRSNSRGLAPLGPARADKFINLATLGPSALASRGMMVSSISLAVKQEMWSSRKYPYSSHGRFFILHPPLPPGKSSLVS